MALGKLLGAGWFDKNRFRQPATEADFGMANQTEHGAAFTENFDFGIFAEPHFAQATAKSGLGRKLLNARFLTRFDVLKGNPTSGMGVCRKGAFVIFFRQHK